MARFEVVEWDAFFGREEPEPAIVRKSLFPIVAASAVIVFMPSTAFADGGGWNAAKDAVVSIADWLCYGVIVFAGGSWMFGNRTKALELLLGSGIGYIIIRHAEDIRKFLASI